MRNLILYFKSSVVKKLFMALFGVFLVLFLSNHLLINLLLLLPDNGEKFNQAADFMAHNPLIQLAQLPLALGFILHIALGVWLTIENQLARNIQYKVKLNSQESYFSKYIFHTGVIILIFLITHLFHFFVKAKFGHLELIKYGSGVEYENLAIIITESFSVWYNVLFYVVCNIFLGFHLVHAINSAVLTIGFNHKTFSPVINIITILYAIIIAIGYSIIPIWIFLK